MTCEETVERSHLSEEYTTVEIEADVTLNLQPVKIAVVLDPAEPDTADWQVAAWTGAAATTRQAQIPPSGTAGFDPGIYGVWAKVTDSPEIPVMRLGYLQLV